MEYYLTKHWNPDLSEPDLVRLLVQALSHSFSLPDFFSEEGLTPEEEEQGRGFDFYLFQRGHPLPKHFSGIASLLRASRTS